MIIYRRNASLNSRPDSVKNEQTAIDFANNSLFGLGGSVFAQNIERGKRVASQIDKGMFLSIIQIWTQAYSPFGGTKFWVREANFLS